jgi:Predicted phosphatases
VVSTKIKNIIFDLDGTLINSAEDVIFCLRHAYLTVPALAHIRPDTSIIGPPLSELIRNLTPEISEDQASAVTRAFRTCYDKSTYERTTLQPGAGTLISNAKKQHIRLFIATNKPRKATLQILVTKQIDLFDAVLTPDFVEGHPMDKSEMIGYILNNWTLQREETIMVGDDASDILAATRNRIPSVVVMNGYGDKNGIREAKPTYIFPTLVELSKNMLNV